MTDLEIILVCMVVPINYALIYMAGKYDFLNLLFQAMKVSASSEEEICLLTGNECTNCGLDGCTYRKGSK